jgi:hypothetical protein
MSALRRRGHATFFVGGSSFTAAGAAAGRTRVSPLRAVSFSTNAAANVNNRMNNDNDDDPQMMVQIHCRQPSSKNSIAANG